MIRTTNLATKGQMHNSTAWTPEEIAGFPKIGIYNNFQRHRTVHVYAHPNHDNMVVTVGIADSPEWDSVICTEPRKDWNDYISLAVRSD